MKITYTGKQENFYPAQIEKLDVKFAKLAKLLDGKGEKQAHVILAFTRGLHAAEITVNYLDHSLMGTADDADQFAAITAAIDKLEKQVLKVRAKRRDIKKGPKEVRDKETSASAAAILEPGLEPAAEESQGPRIFRVNHTADRKPMTLEEALMEMEKNGHYVIYRDARTDRLSVLLRRRDGNFDLIES